MSDKKTFSTAIGYTLAHIQSLIDSALDLGFRKIDEVSTSKSASGDAKMGTTEKIFFGSMGFLGNVGKSYYRKYRELHAKKDATRSSKQ